MVEGHVSTLGQQWNRLRRQFKCFVLWLRDRETGFNCAFYPALDSIIYRLKRFARRSAITETAIEFGGIGNEPAAQVSGKWFDVNPILSCVRHHILSSSSIISNSSFV